MHTSPPSRRNLILRLKCQQVSCSVQHGSEVMSRMALQEAYGLPIVVVTVRHGYNKLLKPEVAEVSCSAPHLLLAMSVTEPLWQ